MEKYKIILLNYKNKNDYKTIKIEYASNFFQRFLGLMGKKDFKGLLFKQKYSNRFLSTIHTLFMRVPIDLIFINDKFIIQEITTVYPWNLYIPQFNNVKFIIELPKNSIKKNNITIKTEIKIVRDYEN